LAGFTQSELAERIGMSVRGYQKYEQGESAPPQAKTEAIARALGCTVADLYKAPETPKTGPNLADLTKADQILEILKNRLPDDAERLRIEAEELKNLIGPHLHLLRQLEARPELVDAVYAAALIRHKSPSNLALKKKGS
jgi:transcriptional regulator with XRE-family HTH domain